MSPDPISFPAAGALGIVLLTGLEAVALQVYHRRTGRGPRLVALLPNLLAGDCLLLALAAALARAGWVWIALALLASLLCHLADLSQRWRE